jgi:transposase
MTDLIERLVPDELLTMFRRVVPPTVIRPQGGGRRRAGDRECLAAIVLVARSGCTWRQLPPVFGPAWPELDWSRCAIDSVSVRAAKGGH